MKKKTLKPIHFLLHSEKKSTVFILFNIQTRECQKSSIVKIWLQIVFLVPSFQVNAGRIRNNCNIIDSWYNLQELRQYLLYTVNYSVLLYHYTTM